MRQSLPEKNRLRASDAAHVEAMFEAKLADLAAFNTDGQEENPVEGPTALSSEAGSESDFSNDLPSRNPVDKSVLTLPEPRRIRDRDHIRLVTGRPCLVCGRLPSDPHHLRFAQSRALSRKVSDEFTVPLCRGHHRELHRYGDEAAWWDRLGIDALEIARALWLEFASAPGDIHRRFGEVCFECRSRRNKPFDRTAIVYCPIADNKRMDAPVSGAALPALLSAYGRLAMFSVMAAALLMSLGLIAAASPPGSARQAI